MGELKKAKFFWRSLAFPGDHSRPDNMTYCKYFDEGKRVIRKGLDAAGGAERLGLQGFAAAALRAGYYCKTGVAAGTNSNPSGGHAGMPPERMTKFAEKKRSFCEGPTSFQLTKCKV